MFLSVVIIARNEEINIARCIESVIKNTKDIPDVEILLVDSASTDRTIDIAKQYPINIVQLKPDWPLSPSAGRFIGVKYTNGKYIYMIDGDMELLEGWLNIAIDFLEKNNNVAVVQGRCRLFFLQKDGSYREYPNRYRNKSEKEKIKHYSGSAVFRRECLEKVGNFQPFLRAEEEAEISYRFIKKGFELFFLPHDSVLHYSIPKNTLAETIRRMRNGLWAGMGDAFVYGIKKGYYYFLWMRFKQYLLFMAMIFISIIGAVVSFFTQQLYLSLFFFSLPFIFTIIQIVRKKSIRIGILSFINLFIISMYILGGMFRKIPETSEYPNNPVWIKRNN